MQLLVHFWHLSSLNLITDFKGHVDIIILSTKANDVKIALVQISSCFASASAHCKCFFVKKCFYFFAVPLLITLQNGVVTSSLAQEILPGHHVTAFLFFISILLCFVLQFICAWLCSLVSFLEESSCLMSFNKRFSFLYEKATSLKTVRFPIIRMELTLRAQIRSFF